MKKRLSAALFLSVFLFFVNNASAELKFTSGESLRLRYEFWKNIFDMENGAKDNRNYFRIKSSAWGNLEFNKDLSLYAKFTNEFKTYTYFYQSTTQKKGYRFDINETVFDNLYVDMKNIASLPVDMRLGRQDFLGMYGEGFLIADGTPLDGSRTFYFNAAKATWRVNEKNSADFVYIIDPRDDVFLPIIHQESPPTSLNTSKEEAYMLYVRNKDIKNLSLEPYFIHKIEGDEGTKLQSQTGRLNVPGVFAKYSFAPFTLRSQVAFETGNYGVQDRQAWGGYTFLDRTFEKKKWSPTASVGYIYLSGDDPATSTNEGWDPLFSRYPWMSELYVNNYNGESGLGYWTNLQMWRTSLSLSPTKKAKVTAWYNYLLANTKTISTAIGNERGHLPQLRFDYAFTDKISAYILGEYFIPGDFHGVSPDDAVFVRTEVSIKF